MRRLKHLAKKYKSMGDDYRTLVFWSVLTLTILVSDDADVTLLTIYDKEEIDNVSDNYIKWLVSEARK